MDWINRYLSSNHLRQFQSVVDAIPNDNNYRSWIGLNFDGPDLYSVKFYYTWFRPLTSSEIKQLLFFGSTSDFYNDYNKVALNNVLDVNSPGSGFTFVLKLDTKLNPTFGYYFKQVFDEHDSFFDLPETKSFLKKGKEWVDIDFVKNQGTFYSPNRKKDVKSYYYLIDPEFKSIIGDLFKDKNIAMSPVIEYAVGNGHRKPSDDRLSKKKVVLMGDQGKLASHYIQEWTDIGRYSQSFIGNGFQVLCPGIYGDNNARSFYVFDFNGSGRLVEKVISII